MAHFTFLLLHTGGAGLQGVQSRSSRTVIKSRRMAVANTADKKTASLTEHVGSDGDSEVRVAAQNVQRVSVCRLLEALVVHFQYLRRQQCTPIP